MLNYKDWALAQDTEFLKEIHGNNDIPNKFKDHCCKPITLDELKALDDQHILKPSETV